MEVSSTLTHPNMVETEPRRRRPAPSRFIGVISGMVARARYCCFKNSIENARTAILERVFYHQVNGHYVAPDIPAEGVIDRKLKTFSKLFDTRVKPAAPVALLDYPKTAYRGLKLKLYQRAAERVFRRGPRDSDATLGTFIKHEKILMKDKRLVPRVIQPRKPEYNVCVGRFIRHLEHEVYSIIASIWEGPTVMKGLDIFAQAEAFSNAWNTFNTPVGVMLDAVRFDQHVSAPMLQWEHSRYLAHYQGQDRHELAHLLSLQLNNKGVIQCPDGSIEYRVRGCRASGDMNTSMGNCLIMCGAMYAFCISIGVRGRLFNNGDDCCLIIEDADLPKLMDALPAFFADIGFILDVEGTARSLSEISFCQTTPVHDGVRWRMVRNPRLSLSKDSTILRRFAPKEQLAYLTAIGECGLALTHGLPILQSYYLALTRAYSAKYGNAPSERLLQHVSGGLQQSGMWWLKGKLQSKVCPVSEYSRYSFAKAFGVLPVVQRQIEKYYDSMDVGDGALWRYPLKGGEPVQLAEPAN